MMIQLVECIDFLDGRGQSLITLLDEYAAELREGDGLSDFARLNLIRELERRQGTHTVLAYAAGSTLAAGDCAAGFAVSIEGFSTFACKPLLNIHDVYVSPRFRGKGISRLLLNKTEEIARRLGCCKLTLEVLEQNTPAVKLYETSGYTGYELDPKLGKAVFMQKKLE